jgi:uncharacterized protein
MSKAQLSAALTEAELDRLGQFLRQFPRAMNLETMDGFFSALICAPERVPMGEVMSRVWGEAAEFASDHEVREITALLLRHWNAISSALNGDEVYWPILLEDEAGKVHANDWAQGFYQGMGLSGGGWTQLMHDAMHGGLIIPILALVHEHDPDPEMRPGIIDEERRQQMIAWMVAGLKKMHDYFAPHRRAEAHEATAPYQRGVPKIGRNDPCPCGSGRKYKQCCAGKNPAVH